MSKRRKWQWIALGSIGLGCLCFVGLIAFSPPLAVMASVSVTVLTAVLSAVFVHYTS